MKGILIRAHLMDEIPKFGSGFRTLAVLYKPKGKGTVTLYDIHTSNVVTIARRRWDSLNWLIEENDPKKILARLRYRHPRLVRALKEQHRANIASAQVLEYADE